MTTYCLQKEPYLEKEKSIIRFNTSNDFPWVSISFDDLRTNSQRHMIPVGSVEFTKEFALVNSIAIPYFSTYPDELIPFLGRKIRPGILKDAANHDFVKPIIVKQFDGAIKKNLDNVNYDSMIWISEPIIPKYEWRIYILDGKILGYSRYDDNDEEYPLVLSFVEKMIAAFSDAPIGYSLDVALLEDGRFVLIEANDAWSLGFYPWGTMKENDYIKLITRRWKEIKKK